MRDPTREEIAEMIKPMQHIIDHFPIDPEDKALAGHMSIALLNTIGHTTDVMAQAGMVKNPARLSVLILITATMAMTASLEHYDKQKGDRS